MAWKGLEGSKILFMEEDISPDVLEFSIRTGLLSKVRDGCVNVLHISGCASFIVFFYVGSGVGVIMASDLTLKHAHKLLGKNSNVGVEGVMLSDW